MLKTKKELQAHIKGLNKEILEFQDRCTRFCQKEKELMDRNEALLLENTRFIEERVSYAKQSDNASSSYYYYKKETDPKLEKLERLQSLVPDRLVTQLELAKEIKPDLISLFANMQRTYLFSIMEWSDGTDSADKENLATMQAIFESL